MPSETTERSQDQIDDWDEFMLEISPGLTIEDIRKAEADHRKMEAEFAAKKRDDAANVSDDVQSIALVHQNEAGETSKHHPAAESDSSLKIHVMSSPVEDWLVTPEEFDSTCLPTELQRDAAEATSVSPEPGRTDATSATPALEDWITEALNLPNHHPERIPYLAYFASRRSKEAMASIRDFSRRVFPLAWTGSKSPGVDSGKSSKTSTLLASASTPSTTTVTNKEWSFWNFFPGTGANSERYPDTTYIPETTFSGLPTWKNLGPLKDQTETVRELVFGCRFANLAADTKKGPSLLQWRDEIPGDDVGFMSIDINGDHAERFLADNGQAGVTALRRSLLRALQSRLGDVEMAAIWIAGPSGTDIILFIALRGFDPGDANDAALAQEGLQQALSDECFRGDAESHTMHDVSEGQIWNRLIAYRRRHWLPGWFSRLTIHQIRDELLRSPYASKRHAEIVAKLKKRRTSRTDRLEFQLLEMMDAPNTGIRFYRGSPAQFAALIARSGPMLGECYSSRVKAGAAQRLYDQIRSEVSGTGAGPIIESR